MEPTSLVDTKTKCLTCNGRLLSKLNLNSPQKHRNEELLSANTLATPTSAHLDRYYFCNCSDVSPSSISCKEKSDSCSKSNGMKDIIISPSIEQIRTPVKTPTRDKPGDHFNFSPSKQLKNNLEKNVISICTNPINGSSRDKNSFLSPIKISGSEKFLEKSNSMDQKRPGRNFRTTRSLSPRPPMQHQHAITLSEENDKIPINDSHDVFNKRKIKRNNNTKPSKLPSISPSNDIHQDHKFYVPSDPWEHMNDISRYQVSRQDSKIIENIWELRSENKKISRQSRSLSSGLSKDYTLTIPDSQNRKSRPKLKYTQSTTSKTIDDQFFHQKHKSISTVRVEAEPITKVASTHNIPTNSLSDASAFYTGPQSLGSIEHKKLLSLSPTLGYLSLTEFEIQNIKNYKKSSSLYVSNQLLQPRHSFSTSLGPRDDELKLNIRRLSEQIRYSCNDEKTIGENINKNNDGFATETIVGQNNGTSDNKNATVCTDALLETRC